MMYQICNFHQNTFFWVGKKWKHMETIMALYDQYICIDIIVVYGQ